MITIIPDKNGPVGCDILLKNDVIKVAEEIRSYDTFDSFVSSLFKDGDIIIGDTVTSTELIRHSSFTKSIDRFHSKLHMGIEYPGEIFYVYGPDPKSDIFMELKEAANTALQINDPPFEDVEDVIDDLLKVNPSIYGYLHGKAVLSAFRPLLLIFNPYPIRFESAEIHKNNLKIDTILSKDIDPDNVRVSIISKKQKPIRKLIKFQGSQIRNDCPIRNEVDIGEEAGILKLRLFYNDKINDFIQLHQIGPSVQKPVWFKEIFNRIDPSYNALESWVDGKGKSQSEDFERGIAILFCLCGLNTIHVGGNYENATVVERRKHFANPETSLDILAWPSSNRYLYLIQCSLGRDKIKDKIDNIAAFAKELSDDILTKDMTKPIICPVIITNVSSSSILEEENKSAEEKSVKIVAGEPIMDLVSSIRNNDIITNDQIHKLLTIRQDNIINSTRFHRYSSFL